MANNLPVLTFNPFLAKAIGLNEAIIIAQVEYWLNRKSKNDKYKIDDNGRKWTYNTYEEWLTNFPFWSERTLRRTFINAEKTGVILAKLQGRGKKARSKWYSLDSNKLSSVLAEVMTGQLGQSQIEGGQNGQFNSNRNGQNGQFAQAITEITNTDTSFAKKQDEATYVEQGENTARPISHDDLTADMSTAELSELQNKYPNLDEERLQSYFIQQKGYWLGKYKTRAELMGKVEALIAQESRKTKVAFQDPTMSPFYRGMRVSVQE